MKNEKLLRAIGKIDDELVYGAVNDTKAKKHKIPGWAKWSSAVAACLCVVIGGIFLFVHIGEKTAPESGVGGSGHNEGSVFMSYAGPVFPLTLKDKDSAVSAARNVDFDFITYRETNENIEKWGNNGGSVIVRDNYQLTNNTQNDITVTAVYPFTGNFQTMKWPVITLDENEVKWNLNAGAYSGSFRGAGDTTSTSLNLNNITSWSEYNDLLSDGSYFADAYSVPESLEQNVVVYRLSNLTDGASEYKAATLCMSFQYDREKTSILTWGFNGGGTQEDTGYEFRCFFIREGLRAADENTKYLVVVGDDLENYTLRGYRNGSCTPGEEIEGVSATVTRDEMTAGELLREIAQIRYNALIDNEFDGDHNRYIDNQISFEMYYQAIVKHFAAYGPNGTDPKERYAFGMLDEIINEAAYQNRILYLSFDVSIPAGGSVGVNIEQIKNASFDFDCSGSENVGIEGYDMVTSVGSGIVFTKQTASVSNYNAIEIVRQNFGFDLANGITEVELDSNEPHYYLEVRAANKN